jgi:hypothetical protein
LAPPRHRVPFLARCNEPGHSTTKPSPSSSSSPIRSHRLFIVPPSQIPCVHDVHIGTVTLSLVSHRLTLGRATRHTIHSKLSVFLVLRPSAPRARRIISTALSHVLSPLVRSDRSFSSYTIVTTTWRLWLSFQFSILPPTVGHVHLFRENISTSTS